MAWVNRTSRDQGPGNLYAQSSSSAAAHLGPGCYETSPNRRIRPNAIPFGTGAADERSALGGAKPPLVTPGPGAYNYDVSAESPTKAHAAVSAFQSKTERSVESVKKANSVPGPGAYTAPESFTPAKKKPQPMFVVHDAAPKGAKVRWARLPTAPSIPTLSQSFGYEQGPQGRLVRHEPANIGHTGQGDDTLGPGEYDPLKGLKSVHKSRAADFSRSKVARALEQELRAKAELPGPGQYADPHPAPSTKKEAMRTSAVFKSSSTRDGDSGKTLTHKHKKMPGPGAYYDGIPKSFQIEKKPEHLQFFGSTTTRFDSAQRNESIAPGPGAYYSPPTSISRPISSSKRQTKQKQAPFSSKTDRFVDGAKVKDQYLAAPGSYNMPSSMSHVLTKVSSRVHTFGSTTKRFDSISGDRSHMHDTPESRLERELNGTGTNRNTNQIEQEKTRRSQKKKPPMPSKMSSIFASSSERFKPLAKGDGPSPGDYEIQPTWVARGGAEGTFKSTSERLKDSNKDAALIPGPGAYAPSPTEHKPLHMARPDVFIGAEPRFKKQLPKVHVPGPGYYTAATVESDWNRPTYNITIATEMELAMMN